MQNPCRTIVVNFQRMDEKTLGILEFPVVLQRLAAYADFGISAELARGLRLPATWKKSGSGNRVPPKRAACLTWMPVLVSAGLEIFVPRWSLHLALAYLKVRIVGCPQYPHRSPRSWPAARKNAAEIPGLAELAVVLPPPSGLIESISRALSERGEVVDQASDRLAQIRRDLKVSHERLLGRLERMVNDPKNSGMLQDSIITQRIGRYVIPLRAEFKGQIRSIFMTNPLPAPRSLLNHWPSST